MMNTSDGGRRRFIAPLINLRTRWWIWELFMLVFTVFSIWITQIQFSFFEMLPKYFIYLDYAQMFFLIDVVLQLLKSYNRDMATILRYTKSCWPKIIASIPWVIIYDALSRNKVWRWFILLRMFHLVRAFELFSRMENSRGGFFFSKAMKILAMYLLVIHMGGCAFFYTAITMPPGEEENTWIGSLTLGKHTYSSFRDMGFWDLYVTSIYFSGATAMTVGYGDIHPVDNIEKIIALTLMLSTAFFLAYISDSMTNRDEKGDPDYLARGQNTRNQAHIRNKDQTTSRKTPVKVNHMVYFDDTSMSEQLIHKKPDLNRKNNLGKTPLHIAASQGHVDATRMLIEAGAEINVIDDFGFTPILEAIEGRHSETVSFLKEKGAKLMIGDAGSFLCSAVEKGDVEYVRWLLEIGMDPSSQDKDMYTPLHVAAKRGSFAMMELLMNPETIRNVDRQGTVTMPDDHKSSTNDKDDEKDTNDYADKGQILYDLYIQGDEKSLSFSYSLGYTQHHLRIEFWKKIYCDNDASKSGRGWLDDDHIDIWGHILLLKTKQPVRCTIMPVHFMFNHSSDMDQWIALVSGSYAPYQPWAIVDLVLMPINHDNGHWLFTCLNLKTWTVTIYDSSSSEYRETWMKKRMQAFDINTFLNSIAYWENSGRNRSMVKLNVQFAKDAPQQKNNMDCGIFVCMWLEAFCNGIELKIEPGKIKEHCVT